MSYDPIGPGAPYGASGNYDDSAEQSRKGSVRAARERLRAAQSQQITELPNPQAPLRQLPQSKYLQPNAPGRPQPTQTPQWSVSEYDDNQNKQPLSPQQQWPLSEASAAESRRVPPQRPARGSDVPPMPATFYDNSRDATSAGSLPRVGKGMSNILPI